MAYTSDYYAYRASQELMREDPSFYALLMAAMRKADTVNHARLIAAFPEVWADLDARYNAPAGILSSDPEGLRAKVTGYR